MPLQPTPLQRHSAPAHAGPGRPDHGRPFRWNRTGASPSFCAKPTRSGATAEVLLALERHAVEAEVLRTAGGLQRAGAGRPLVGLHALVGVGVLRLGQVEATRALRDAPWPAARSAVRLSRALTWSGVRFGRCWRSRAAAPETNAAACEVPLPRKNRSPVRAAG